CSPTAAPVSASQIRIVSSPELEMMRRLSGEYTALHIPPICPPNGPPTAAPVSASQIRIVSSFELEIMRRPSGEYATVLTWIVSIPTVSLVQWACIGDKEKRTVGGERNETVIMV
ncbi:hypothetical protein FRC15_006049, partial [Serendipita sp. 397]